MFSGFGDYNYELELVKSFQGQIEELFKVSTHAFLFIFCNRVEEVWDNTGTPCLEHVTQLK